MRITHCFLATFLAILLQNLQVLDDSVRQHVGQGTTVLRQR